MISLSENYRKIQIKIFFRLTQNSLKNSQPSLEMDKAALTELLAGVGKGKTSCPIQER